MVEIIENACKFAKIVSYYPEYSLEELLGMMQMPPIDVNTSIWKAEELQLVVIDGEKQKATLGEKSVSLVWSEPIPTIKARMIYAFEQINSREADMEEEVLRAWFAGYPIHDVIISYKELVEAGVLSAYKLLDTAPEPEVAGGDGKTPGENVYTYYTLAGNEQFAWGKKQFKDPSKVEVV